MLLSIFLFSSVRVSVSCVGNKLPGSENSGDFLFSNVICNVNKSSTVTCVGETSSLNKKFPLFPLYLNEQNSIYDIVRIYSSGTKTT